MKKNWSISVMSVADRIAIIKRPAFLPRRDDILRVRSELSGKIEEYKVWSIIHDFEKRTIVIQVIRKAEGLLPM